MSSPNPNQKYRDLYLVMPDGCSRKCKLKWLADRLDEMADYYKGNPGPVMWVVQTKDMQHWVLDTRKGKVTPYPDVDTALAAAVLMAEASDG